MAIKYYFIGLVLWVSLVSSSFADELTFKLTKESQQLIGDSFCFMTAMDLNNNNIKEIVLSDIGQCQSLGGKIDLSWSLHILELEEGVLKLKWQKKWEVTDTNHIWRTTQLIAWSLGERGSIEAIPPYLNLQWIEKEYVLRQQLEFDAMGGRRPKVGSWVFPWLSPTCYGRGEGIGKETLKTGPRECLIGVRDFSGRGEPKLVTTWQEENPFYKKDAKQLIRVRKLEPGFPIEWENDSPVKFDPKLPETRVALDLKEPSGLLIGQYWIFESTNDKKKYQMRRTDIPSKESMGLAESKFEDLPYLARVGRTQKNNLAEYWGYRSEELKKPREEALALLRRVVLKPGLTGFIKEDINFPHHEPFLGVGFFDLQDIDGDGLDEVLLVEQTGRREFGEDGIGYLDVKDYIRILKWSGKEYQTLWVSPPYMKRGTRFLVEGLNNTGKKQLVVGTVDGTVQVWERE